MGQNFRVCLRYENMSFGFQFALQVQIIFNNSVMNQHHTSIGTRMRMGIFLSGAAMSRPASMPDSVTAIHRIQLYGFFQIVQLAGSTADNQLSIFPKNGQSSGVVAPVFQFPEPL